MLLQDLIDCFMHENVVEAAYEGRTDVLVSEMVCSCYDGESIHALCASQI